MFFSQAIGKMGAFMRIFKAVSLIIGSNSPKNIPFLQQKHTILSAKTYHSLSLRISYIHSFLRDFCTNSPEFEPKHPRNCRIFRENALFCAKSAEKSCNTAEIAL